MNFFRQFFGPQLDREAFEAYWHKLPERINVEWFRSGKFIVGNIQADGDEFMTQGRNADEFIDMVNETVYAVYDIPEQYFGALRSAHREFTPQENVYKELRNVSVSKSSFSLRKKSKPQVA